MANRHYGTIGDIWKHLPLADVLSIEQPTQYWESHAGSAQYELTHSAERDFGVFHFLKHAHQHDTLADSAYFWLSSTLAQSERPMVPGSPAIAMASLSPKETRFRFCDTDRKSLDSIKHTARELDGPLYGVETWCIDGPSHIHKHLKNTSFTQAKNTFLFIDPYTLLKPDGHGLTALDIFCQAALLGIKTMLWFGCSAMREQVEMLDKLHRAFTIRHLDVKKHAVWLGQIHLKEVTDVYHSFDPGVWGCNILCANLSQESLATCAHLGRAMEQIYTTALFPDNTSGALTFSYTRFQTGDGGPKTSRIVHSSVSKRASRTRHHANRHTESLT